jgi:mRNA interferase RelE/StbE
VTVHLMRSVIDALAAAPPPVQKAFIKQMRLLVRDLQHPGLHAKKYDESNDRWQARVNDDWRFYFRIEGDVYPITDLMPHPK